MRGATEAGTKRLKDVIFQSTPPYAGSDGQAAGMTDAALEFQSTPPYAGSDATDISLIQSISEFQSTPPYAGSDV